MRYRHLWEEDGGALEPFVAPLVPLVHEASNPFADWFFGEHDLAGVCIGAWLRRPSSELYVGRAIVLFEETTPTGCLIGLGGEELARCRAADFAEFCRSLGDDPDADAVVAETVNVSRTLFPPVAPGEYYISRVAVRYDRRGRGLGRALVERARTLARAQGYARVRLDVSADNLGAIRAYEAAGLRVVGTSRSEEAGLAYTAMVG
jgi:ribosomal protein S18 acetylase RimI-like enzyme